jgi:FKBP-type peptidyl-prolyl cis-trans isomerase FklB
MSLAALVLWLSAGPAAGAAELASDAARLGYSIGYQVGSDFRRQGVEIDPQVVLMGLRDALTGSEPRMTLPEMREALVELSRRTAARQQQRREALGRENLEEGRAFLAENAEQPGVQVLESGLQVQVLEEGSGEPPGPTDSVTVHYRGTLIDGSEFDSSHGRGKPASFRLDQVIAGWTEGLQRMRPGARYRLFVPGELAYGERGWGDKIGPHSTLVFEVELLSVTRDPTAPQRSSDAQSGSSTRSTR